MLHGIKLSSLDENRYHITNLGRIARIKSWSRTWTGHSQGSFNLFTQHCGVLLPRCSRLELGPFMAAAWLLYQPDVRASARLMYACT